MPDDRDTKKDPDDDEDEDLDQDRDLDREEDETDDEADDAAGDDGHDEEDETEDAADDAEDEDEADDEDEIAARAREKKRARQGRPEDQERRAVRRKAAETEEAKPRRSRRSAERPAEPRRAEARRPPERQRRRSRRELEEEQRRSKRRAAGPSAPKRRRPERAELEPIEIVEPERPPEADIDLTADLEPTWEPGVIIGGGLGLAGVAFAFVALLTSGGQASIISIIGLVILLLAISSGNIGVLARKTWGYVLALGATGLGVAAGLIWALYAVVGTDLSPLWPLFFFLCNLGSVILLFHMRWGPGPLADERDRMRSLKLRTANHTTVSGEFALSGSIAAVLASVLCGLLLMGAATNTRSPASPSFVDGAELQSYTEAPELGSVVLARWGNEDYFFLGRVEETRGGDEFHVVYLDNDRAWVRLADIRRDTVRAGMSVHVHVQGSDGWLPAVVTQRSGNRIEAELTNNQRVWVPLGMIRVRETS